MKVEELEEITGEYISMDNRCSYIRWSPSYWELPHGISSEEIFDTEELEKLEAAYQEYIKEQK